MICKYCGYNKFYKDDFLAKRCRRCQGQLLGQTWAKSSGYLMSELNPSYIGISEQNIKLGIGEWKCITQEIFMIPNIRYSDPFVMFCQDYWDDFYFSNHNTKIARIGKNGIVMATGIGKTRIAFAPILFPELSTYIEVEVVEERQFEFSETPYFEEEKKSLFKELMWLFFSKK